MKKERGSSYVEMLVVMVVILVVMIAIFSMVLHFGKSSETEYARTELLRESRFILSAFASELKSAGSVLTVSHSSGFLSTHPFFNGIYPLDNTTTGDGAGGTPDGIILAISDPEAVTKLTSDYNPSTGTDIPVEDTTVKDGVSWAAGDIGIIIGPAVDPLDPSKPIGYYVFYVDSVTTDTITMRNAPVYYSGLLNISSNNLKYTDYVGASPTAPEGNNVLYPTNSPVMRLTNFSIYILNQVADAKKTRVSDAGGTLYRDIRQLVRISDTQGDADPISTGRFTVISENIWDMQISYTAYTLFPDTTLGVTTEYFAGATISDELDKLLYDIRMRFLKTININMVVLTGEYEGIAGEGESIRIPGFANEASYTLPKGKYGYKLMQFSVEPRNFNICI